MEREFFLDRLRRQLVGLMAVEHVEVSRDGSIVAFYGSLYGPPDEVFEQLSQRFAALGYTAFLSREGRAYRVVVVPGVARSPHRSRPWVNLALFVATFLTVTLAGANPEVGGGLVGYFLSGLPFSLTLMLILLAHELAHYFVSRRYGSPVSLPYFIPMPMSILGTMGAVIFQRERVRDRKALFDIGIAGPLAGFLVAVPLLFLGLLFTRVGRPSDFLPPEQWTGIVYQEGNSLLYLAAKYLVFGRLLPDPRTGEDVWLSLPASPGGPIVFAAWAGLLVTALNLMPIGQLDGGHMAYALLGRRAWKLAYGVIGLLVLLGLFLWAQGNPAWPTWIIWAVLGLLFGPRHPPPLNDASGLDARRIALGLLMLLVFIVTFVPVPLIAIPVQ
ncbi:MAG: site-2 protease family protein [Thermoflexia bacterium]|nr:MAG: site-2 protease family protein [Thermoflexia bacterium]